MSDLQHLGLTRAEFTDKGLQLVRPTLGPTVMILGITDNTSAPLEDPYRIERGASISDFDLTSGLPSEITKAVQEAQSGGAENIEVFVVSSDGSTRHSTISNADRYTALGRAYTLLRNHPMDLVVPVGAFVDSTGLSAGTSFAYQLANFCYRGTREYTARFGVIGATPPTATVAPTGIPTLAEMATWVAALGAYSTAGVQGTAFPEYDGTTDADLDNVPDTYALWATSDEAMPTGAPPADAATVEVDADKNPIDIGAYMCCYSGWERTRNTAARRLYPTAGYYHTNGAAAFAGLIAATKSHEAPRNIPLPGMERIRALSPVQADSLAIKRFITSANKLGQYMVYDAMTSAYNISDYVRSDFVRITTVRIMHDAVDQVRAAANPFIRLTNSVTSREALKAALDEGLSLLKEKGLEKWDFNLIYTTAMKVLGQLEIELSLWIEHEIQHITVRVGLRQ